VTASATPRATLEEAAPGIAPPTALLAPGSEIDEGLGTGPDRETTLATDPLRFVFPAAGPAPVSAWRPPLYPTPWAPTAYDHFYFARPIAADEVNWPLWDYRYGGVFFANVVHTGVDIAAPKGTPVLAAGSGRVIWAGYGLYLGGEDPNDPYGLAVAIQHDFGYQNQALYTVYGHLDRVDVLKGEYVEVGDLLGLVGETGRVTGPHLHFEVRIGDNDYFTTRNPELWLVPPQGWGVVAGRVTDSGGNLRHGQDVVIHSLASSQNWLAKTYGAEAINSDLYYRENVVVGDLPSGRYEVRIPYAGINYLLEVEVLPGMVTYFTFRGHASFTTGLPPTPEYTPVEVTPFPESTPAP
jgi:murein DD-endopeptidase MepM/ murein hydrolase activator NlpD